MCHSFQQLNQQPGTVQQFPPGKSEYRNLEVLTAEESVVVVTVAISMFFLIFGCKKTNILSILWEMSHDVVVCNDYSPIIALINEIIIS